MAATDAFSTMEHLRLAAAAGGPTVRYDPDAYVAVWMPDDHQGLRAHIPRAVAAHEAPSGHSILGPSLTDWCNQQKNGYLVGEKMDGHFVLWDGRTLFSKGGRPYELPHAFRTLLPPALPFVGELCLGNGLLRALGAGNAASTNDIWSRARVIAFDLLLPPSAGAVPYERRYAMLTEAVADWTRILAHRGVDISNGGLLPLGVLRQRPASDGPEMFREIVQGVPWSARKLRPWGVPVRDDRGSVTWPVGDDPFPADAPGAAGEGLMLWQKDAPAQNRGATNRATHSIIKASSARCATRMGEGFFFCRLYSSKDGGFFWPRRVVAIPAG